MVSIGPSFNYNTVPIPGVWANANHHFPPSSLKLSYINFGAAWQGDRSGWKICQKIIIMVASPLLIYLYPDWCPGIDVEVLEDIR